MASFNKVIIAGNLTRDPELRYTPKGTAMARIGLAVNRVYTSMRAVKRRKRLRLLTWMPLAARLKSCGQYMKKGRPSWWKAG
jgi:single-strand DNA-binding protein